MKDTPGKRRKVRLDLDAQPPSAINRERRIDRATSELLGLAKGVLADGVVTESEAHVIADWLEANPDVVPSWPVNVLARRINQIFEDGIVDEEERLDLAELLENIVGGGYGIAAGLNVSSGLPLDRPPPQLEFTGRVYVFTGKFAFGPRKACQEVVAELGATCENGITKRTNCLVIGTFGSRDWIQSPYGRKIEKAVRYRDEDGLPLSIISEDHWANFIDLAL
jgi:NAD-dependent DNA ligase